MGKEIGSNFDLEPSMDLSVLPEKLYSEQFGVKGSDELFLSTGRGAENFILDTIEERNPKIKKVIYM